MAVFVLEVLRLAVWLALLVAIFVPLERLAGVRTQRILRRQMAVDLGYYFLNSLLIGLALAAPLMLVGASLRALVPAAVLGAIAALPGMVRLVLALLVAETGFYWAHRLSHEIPFLWRFHSIHHSAEEVDFLTNSRAHPVDMVLTRLTGFVPVVALGLADGLAMPALVLVVATFWGFFVHANLRWRFGFLEHVVATPFFHRWHHTNDTLRDRNYAPMLPLLDHLFGTYVSPSHWPTAYGIDATMPGSLGRQLVDPFMPRARADAAPKPGGSAGSV